MHSKYYLTEELKPNGADLATAFTADDVLFDWTAFEIPKGTAALVSFMAKVAGTNGAAQKKSFDLFFAKSIDGVAPPTFGTSNDAKDAVHTASFRPYLIGYQRCIPAADGDTADSLVAYNILGNGQGADNGDRSVKPVLLQGDPDGFPGDSTHSKTTPGYQTIFVAATISTADFGTGVLVDNGSGYSVGDTTINCDGTAGDTVFAPGDYLIAQDGALVGTLKTVTDDGSHTTLTLEAPGLVAALADNDEILNRNPVTLRLGFEY